MTSIPLLEAIIVALITAFNIILGGLVYFQDKHSKSNRTFFLFTLSLTAWLDIAFISELIKDVSIIIILSRIVYGSVIITAITLFCFSCFFTKRYPKKITGILLAFVSVTLLSILFFTDFVILTIDFSSTGFNIINGPLYFLFVIFILLLAGSSIFNFLIKYKKSQNNLEKTQTIYFFLGFGIFIVTNIVFNIIVRQITGSDFYYRLGNYSAIFLVGFIAYAIFKHHLFNIKVITTEILTIIMGVMLLVRIPLSKTSGELAFNLIFFHIFLVLGIMLIRTVWLEIHRVEEIEKLNKEKLAAYDKIKKQADELKLANIDLQKLLEMKSEFMRVASHQLRTPTSSIMGMLSMLVEGSVPPEKRDGFIKMAYEASEKLSIIIRNVLSATSLDSGRLELSFQKADLRDIIHKAVNECKKLALQKKLALRVNMPENLPLITADTHWLKQVFNNLINNAVFYTPKGEITIDVKDNLNNITATIQDNGVGIALEDKDRLFKKFTRGQHTQQVHPDGSGLGLYIAKSIIDLHHGAITIQSDGQSKGTAVEVVLPKGK